MKCLRLEGQPTESGLKDGVFFSIHAVGDEGI